MNKIFDRFKDMPKLAMLLVLTPAAIIASNAANAAAIGLATAFVLILSNIVVAALFKWIPTPIRVFSHIVIIAGIVAATEMLFNAYFLLLSQQLGIFVPLIAVNCIIFAQHSNVMTLAESGEVHIAKRAGFAVLDGLVVGVAFTVVLLIMAVFREFFGAGTLFGFTIFEESASFADLLILQPGTFLIIGVFLATVNAIAARRS